ncbi:hypothetical protein UT300012_22770 [Paraclostridium bifermentans]
MNKKLAAFLVTGLITMSTSGVIAHAESPGASMDDSKPAVTKQTKINQESGIFNTDSPEASNPNAGGDTQAGPTIKVKKDKFLVEKGSNFDFAKELGLSIVDEKDGDMTDHIKVPTIPTDKVGRISKTVKAVNSKGEVSTKDIVVNVIEVEGETSVASMDDVKKMDFSKLVKGDVSGLTIALKSTDEANKTMTVTISDGVNTIDKTVKLTVDGSATPEEGKDPNQKPAEDNTTGDTTGKDETAKPEDTTTGEQVKPNDNGATANAGSGGSSSGLPQTGAVASTGLVGLVAAGVGGGTYYFKKRK